LRLPKDSKGRQGVQPVALWNTAEIEEKAVQTPETADFSVAEKWLLMAQASERMAETHGYV
jgi:hypothetical protein